jgi:hypothetical protein
MRVYNCTLPKGRQRGSKILWRKKRPEVSLDVRCNDTRMLRHCNACIGQAVARARDGRPKPADMVYSAEKRSRLLTNQSQPEFASSRLGIRRTLRSSAPSPLFLPKPSRSILLARSDLKRLVNDLEPCPFLPKAFSYICIRVVKG